MSLAAFMPKQKSRTDTQVLRGGINFSLVFTGLIWWAGGRLVRDWRTPNPENAGA